MSTGDIRAAKRTLRREVVARILAMDPGERATQERTLERLFPGLPGLDAAGRVLLYLSHLPEEFETRGMIRQALDLGKVVTCPRVDRPERRLRLYRVSDPDRDLVPGPFGIPEPGPSAAELPAHEIDWALIPGIAFDAQGYRLGRGAGYYDRLLPTLRPDAVCLAMVLGPQWAEDLPREPHDIPVHGVFGVDRRVISPGCPLTRSP